MKTMTQTRSARRRSATWLLSGMTCAALALWWITVARHAPETPATPLPEVSRSELFLQDGRFFYAGETNLFSGVMVEHYAEGGRVRSRSVVSNGLLQGVSEGWYTNGQMQVREHFQAGVSHGPRTKWYADGQLSSQATIVAGQLHGPYRRWHENGTPAEEVEMNQGQPNGWSRSYYPSGAVKAEARLEHGQVREQKFWPDREFYLTAQPSGSQ